MTTSAPASTTSSTAATQSRARCVRRLRSEMARIAFFTFAILHEAIPHQMAQGFVDRLESTWSSAETSPGFIARAGRGASGVDWGELTLPRFYDPEKHPAYPPGGLPFLAAPSTLSLWDNVASVQAFAYGGHHLEALQN